MSAGGAIALVCYVSGAFVWCVMSLFTWDDNRGYSGEAEETSRRAARCALAAPIWPIPLGILTFMASRRLLRSLLADADILRRDR